MHLLCASALFMVATPGTAQGLDDLTRLRPVQSKRASSANEDWRGSNVDYKFVRPGETLTLADLKGPGTIRRLWMTVLPSEPGYSRLITLRIYWDGEKEPSVECPIGDFFGVGHGVDSPFESIPVRASAGGKARSSHWVMPFHRTARVTVTNEGEEATWGFYFNVDWEAGPIPARTPTFHAMYRQETPARPGNYLIADIKGEGHYVGTVLSTRSNSPGWWGEGDDLFTVDGEATPSLRGTGLEDYFGEAWGLRKVSGAYSGASLFEGGFPGARTTCYRWHVTDPVRFRRGLRVEIEHKGVAVDPSGKDLGNNNERPDDYSSVAFWYQTGPHQPYPPLPKGHARLPFDFRQMLQTETMVSDAKATVGTVQAVKVSGLHRGGQLEWAQSTPGAELTIPFDVPADGNYQILLLATRRWDGAQVSVSVDEQGLGDADFYSPTYDMHQEVPLPYTKLTKGRHRLRLRNTGKDARSAGGWIGLDGFVVHLSSATGPSR
jgi:hypothetical protein